MDYGTLPVGLTNVCFSQELFPYASTRMLDFAALKVGLPAAQKYS